MATRIATDSFGKVGRCFVRAMVERRVSDLDIVATDVLTGARRLAHLIAKKGV